MAAEPLSRTARVVDERPMQLTLPRLYSANSLMCDVGVWVLLAVLEPTASEHLARLCIAGSNTPLPYALHSSMSGKFIVRKRKLQLTGRN